jgi:hypothetical protein
MQASWNHGHAYYRCKFPTEYAVTEGQHGKTVYVREGAIVPDLDAWIASLFDDEHLDSTCKALAAVSDLEPEDDEGRELDLRRQLKECDTKLAHYRHFSSRTPTSPWSRVGSARSSAIAGGSSVSSAAKPAVRKFTKAQIKALVRELKDIVAVLADADPDDKRAIYDELGVNLMSVVRRRSKQIPTIFVLGEIESRKHIRRVQDTDLRSRLSPTTTIVLTLHLWSNDLDHQPRVVYVREDDVMPGHLGLSGVAAHRQRCGVHRHIPQRDRRDETTLASLGIAYKHSRPYHPQTCGKVERFHQTEKKFLARQDPPIATIRALQHHLDRFVNYYNTTRPHRSLGRRTPLDTFTARSRAYPRLTPITADGYRLRHDTIDRAGKITIRYKGRLHHIGLGRAPAGQTVTVLLADRDIHVLNKTGQPSEPSHSTPPATTSPNNDRCLRSPATSVSDVSRHHSVSEGRLVDWRYTVRLTRTVSFRT